MDKREPPGEADTAERPVCDPSVIHDLRVGHTAVHQAFLASKIRFAAPNTTLVRIGDPQPLILLIRSGFAVRSCNLADGRRAILDLSVPGDICGLEHAFTRYPVEEITTAGRLAYHALDAPAFRGLFSHPQAALRIFALIAEARYRVERVAATIGRFDAGGRLCVLLLDIYDRLRRRDLIHSLTFPLPLTQEQIADYLGLTLVHVNRTLRRLREERLVVIERQVVTILAPDKLRVLVYGLPQSAELNEPILPTEHLTLSLSH